MSVSDGGTKSFVDMDRTLGEYRATVDRLAQRLSDAKPHLQQIAGRARWHVRGCAYHFTQLQDKYRSVASSVGARASLGADYALVHSREVQELYFELYALVNLARITLDNLREYLRPLFVTHYQQLPKSVRDFVDGDTSCKVYARLRNDPAFLYLIELRDCLVHYRTLGTDDILLAIREGVDVSDIEGHDFIRQRPLARAWFRELPSDGVAVNLYLPDRIFDLSGPRRKLAAFSYDLRINLLSQALGFVSIPAWCIATTLQDLYDKAEPIYTWQRK